MDPAAEAMPGVRVRVLDGDRSLQLRVSGPHSVVVEGLLREPVLRVGPGGVWVNAGSPTAAADRLVQAPGSGWVRVSRAASFSWHDHRLAPPPVSKPGPAGRFSVPILVDGRPAAITGTFWRVPRPEAWPWAVGALAVLGTVSLLAVRGGRRATLTVALGVTAGLAALLAVTTFAARDAPNGRVAWLQIVAGAAIGLVLAAALARLNGRRRVHAAGLIGALALAVSIGSLSVFWHGVVVSALPGDLARLACAVALVGGAAAAVLSFAPDVDRQRTGRR